MKYEEILQLAQAGFTAQQIAAFAQIANQQPAPQPVPVAMQPQPVPMAMQPQPLAAITPGGTSEQNGVEAFTAQVMNELQNMKTVIQANNLINSSVSSDPPTTDQILAEVIAPSNLNPNNNSLTAGKGEKTL